MPEFFEDVPAPEVEACIRHGGRAFRDHLGVVLIVGLAVGALGLVAEGLTSGPPVCVALGMAGLLLVVRPLEWGFSFLCLRAVRDEDPEARDVLRAFAHYGDVVFGHLALVVMVVAGLCLLVVPGVLVYLRTRFVRYLVIDEGLDFMSAIRESIRLTRGQTGRLAGITAAGILAVVIGVLPFGLGIAPALIWWDLTLASLYYASEPDYGEELEAGPLPDPSTA